MSRLIRSRRLPLLAALLVSVAPAFAQLPTGSRINPTPGAVGQIEDSDPATAIRVMNSYGRCVARNRPDFAATVLSFPVRSPEQWRAVYHGIGGGDRCLGDNDVTMTVRAPLLAGAMAEWLILSRHRDADLAGISAMPEERMAEIGLAPRTAYEDVALCVARLDPSGIRALIDTDPASPQERAILRRIVPSLGSCLPEGQAFTFGPPSLRGLLAVGLYRVLSTVSSLAERN